MKKNSILFSIALSLILTHLSAQTHANKTAQPEKNLYSSKSKKETSKLISISGILQTELYYGAPGFGEDTKTDQKVYPYILFLDQPITVLATDKIENNYNSVEKIQLTTTQEIQLKHYKGKRIKVEGELFEADNGNHYTKILMLVVKITVVKP